MSVELTRLRLQPAAAVLRPVAGAERETLVLRIRDGNGNVGLGEASPLPGYSNDDAENCARALESQSWRKAAALSHETLRDQLESVDRALPPDCPAARYAAQSSLLDLRAQQLGRPAWSLLRAMAGGIKPDPSLLPIATLLDSSSTEALLGSARAAVRCGVRTLKVKVSRTDFGTELEQLSELRSEVGNAVALRLDANQKWPAAEARRNLELLSKIGPELVEEPVRDADFRALAHSSVPVALDESLQQPGLLERIDPFIHACQIRAIVLKPTTLGGFLRCLRLAEQAGALGLEVLVSHTLDGPIAMAGAAALALAVASTEHASGLARHPALPAWPEQRVFAITPAHVIRTEHPGLGLGEVHVRAA